MSIDQMNEARAEAAFVAYQDALGPRRRLIWSSMSEDSKKPWRRVAEALAPNADEKVRRSTQAIVEDVIEKRARYFERTTGHFDRMDMARSYRRTAVDIAVAIAAEREVGRNAGSGNDHDADELVGMLRDMIDEDVVQPPRSRKA